ncbi:ganglioside GM2 activator [Elysia marginata]|uniref:Ganglioside GM2 activator n=1 Tax=Elysia marginata TaxID=1093978 RepID=A0AAV4H3R5_9GAST|nr:ganglioside GM2 activator [Elysia marginata]
MEPTNVLFFCGFSLVLVLRMVQGGSLSVTNCGDLSKSLVKVTKFEYSPNPVNFPSNITIISLEYEILQDIVAPVSVNTVIEVSAGGRVLQIPCINDIGSCFISDICEKVETDDCPDFFKQNGIQCQCPFTKGTSSLSNLKFHVPLEADKGNIRMKTEVYTNNVFAFCLEIQVNHD